jgi:hypothetical protein
VRTRIVMLQPPVETLFLRVRVHLTFGDVIFSFCTNAHHDASTKAKTPSTTRLQSDHRAPINTGNTGYCQFVFRAAGVAVVMAPAKTLRLSILCRLFFIQMHRRT